MSKVIEVVKRSAVVVSIEKGEKDDAVVLDVGNLYTRRQCLSDFARAGLNVKVGDKFLHTDILESLDDQPEEKRA